MSETSAADPEQRPAGNQFSLRGLFVLITAVSVILALLALAIRQPLHWLGTLGVVAFCLAMIGCLELQRKLFPPKPRQPYYVPPAGIPFGPLPVRGGENPFAATVDFVPPTVDFLPPKETPQRPDENA